MLSDCSYFLYFLFPIGSPCSSAFLSFDFLLVALVPCVRVNRLYHICTYASFLVFLVFFSTMYYLFGSALALYVLLSEQVSLLSGSIWRPSFMLSGLLVRGSCVQVMLYRFIYTKEWKAEAVIIRTVRAICERTCVQRSESVKSALGVLWLYRIRRDNRDT